ncbi:MAG TPA: FCD domain-containing protein [Candidatus Enterocloster excrementipullorum]|uniref:FCD domain-containing protein n=1 Tax=Candidatus Enterocloster excrementipullorum TaxID=2838559 RepID=A0A9D2SIP2_9FIRM|nr:FCD domain-containing protein [Candidatus Enterocloster excrementipullorum]
MSDFGSKETEYLLLQMISQYEKPIGAGFLADMLKSEDSGSISEATIGRCLRRFEKQGFLKSEKYNGRSRGRVITPAGELRLKELAAERRQAKAVLDTIEIFNNGFGEHLRNLLVTREIVEPEAAALAAQNAGEENIRALRAILDEAAQLTKAGASMAETDAPFHIAIARASGNPVLEAVVTMLRTDRDYSPEIEHIINASSVGNPSDHRSIFKAIEARDPDSARRIMKQHIHNLIVTVSQYERERSAAEQPAGAQQTAPDLPAGCRY